MRKIPALYLASYALSLLGNSIAAVALPLLLLQTTGSLSSTGVLALVTAVPAFLAGILLGVVIDRVNRRSASIVSDLISAGAVAALPLIDLATGLTFGWFVLFGVLGALGDVPGMTARDALLPAIARHSGASAERLVGLRESVSALIVVVGPAMAGTLMGLLDGSTVLWITAGTSLSAALLTMLLPRDVGDLPAGATTAPVAPAPVAVDGPDRRRGAPAEADGPRPVPDPAPPSGWADLREGWRVLFRGDRTLRAVTLFGVLLITVVSALQGVLLPGHFTAIDATHLLGFVLTALATGTLVGSGLYAGLGARIPRRTWLTAGLAGTAVGIGVLGALPAVGILFAGAFVLGLASGLLGTLVGVVMLEGIPEHARGRVIGTQNALAMLGAPMGMVLAAFLGQLAGLGAAGLVVAGAWCLVALAVWRAPAFRDLGAPRDQDPADAVDPGAVAPREAVGP